MTHDEADAYIEWLHEHSPVDRERREAYALESAQRNCRHAFTPNRVCRYCGIEERAQHTLPRCPACDGVRYVNVGLLRQPRVCWLCEVNRYRVPRIIPRKERA